MQSLIDMLKAMQLHPVADHFTVALVLIAILIDLAGSLASSRLWLRNMAVTLMVLGAIAAFASNITGGWEADRVWDNVNGPGKDVLKLHAEIGDYLPWVIGGLAVWRLGVQFLGFISGTRPIYLLAALIVGGTIIYQGHEGGELVYTYGVGTALLPSPNASPSAAAAASPEATASAATPIPTVYAPSATPTPEASAPSPSVTSTPPAAAPAPAPSSSSASPSPAANPSGSASPEAASPSPTSRTL
jgi:uncharacterized membrane protein